ncbi:hypothetical protein PDIP_31570 [Penicillium digitatum Pd1]|uniref:Uncharacterized protein n=1 Tax=Penicillium digitatum (strain Pd1 / CECT 20795) TaxID=1170230 RepID=K9G809_PEND1|nr:hypothetical protein PDIP_31570 [Penicillium digitatum Pd1]EKV17509.1 hypothetical protein PDIP_31570 [Penicillium digitatum Pd1]
MRCKCSPSYRTSGLRQRSKSRSRSNCRFVKQISIVEKRNFGVGDLVFITTKDWLQDRPSRKLSHLASGPYRIIEK